MIRKEDIKNYQTPQMQLIRVDVSDVIRTSVNSEYHVEPLTNNSGWSDYN